MVFINDLRQYFRIPGRLVIIDDNFYFTGGFKNIPGKRGQIVPDHDFVHI